MDQPDKSQTKQLKQVCNGCGEPPFMTKSSVEDNRRNSFQPLKACTRCKQAFYHNEECQKRHYPQHKLLCRMNAPKQVKSQLSPPLPHSQVPAYTVRSSPTKGRSLVAVRDITMGERLGGQDMLLSKNNPHKSKSIISGAKPMVPPVLLEVRRATHCAVCFQPSSSKKGSCSVTNQSYTFNLCSPKCRTTAERFGLMHEVQIIDRVLKRGRIPKLLPTALLAYRLLLACHQSKTTPATSLQLQELLPVLSKSDIFDMTPQLERKDYMVVEEDDSKAHEMAIQMTVLSLLQETPHAETMVQGSDAMEEIKQLLCRIKANAFSITANGRLDTETAVVGTCVFEAPAYLVNHACSGSQTALQTFELIPGRFPLLVLLPRCFILAGQEITISYTTLDPSTPKAERQNHLRQSYHFDCQCLLCSSE